MWVRPPIAFLAIALACISAAPLKAQAIPADPLASPMWNDLAGVLLKGGPIGFDDRVIVAFPDIAENQHAFPVTIDARKLGDVRRILLFADLNPIPVAIDFAPGKASAYLSIRIKLDQRTPVRVAVQTADGAWHVNGGWIDAAGGGCSAPPVSRVKGDWSDHLGEIRGLAIADGDAARLRLTLRHPMDTGLVDNISLYHLETLAIERDGATVGAMRLEASVAEDPALTLMVPGRIGDMLTIAARDTNGRTFHGKLMVTAAPAHMAAR
ncbi:quinoprotein dehydrogenase-associated SoxYZ-like carrier [Sphingomonas sp. 37zxx]|uniref:quinoprotein dehydrogenase-associated SoxYZ-like carrier n=1 Tax=Sphingomonas sp. 37zxx TaxID=1550073 RepID=UPI00053BE754|nr:quinoprotein dehydrogenase-associated SoxYZ-like carrier [Sphingomonas sp. 37zxx]